MRTDNGRLVLDKFYERSGINKLQPFLPQEEWKNNDRITNALNKFYTAL